jgi:hypothetical protein
MAVYLITFDLKGGEAYRSDLLDALSEVGATLVTESSYLLASNVEAVAIRNWIQALVDDNIVLYVLRLSGWAGFGPDSVNNRLKQLLG